jgi:hypothetical protein
MSSPAEQASAKIGGLASRLTCPEPFEFSQDKLCRRTCPELVEGKLAKKIFCQNILPKKIEKSGKKLPTVEGGFLKITGIFYLDGNLV